MTTNKTTEELREYFKDNELNYNMLHSDIMFQLKRTIEKKLTEFNESTTNKMVMKLSPIKSKDYEFDMEKGGLKYFDFKVDGDYFKEREAISFNKDGFIAFAGWSDSTNIQPFKDAFKEWVLQTALYHIY